MLLGMATRIVRSIGPLLILVLTAACGDSAPNDLEGMTCEEYGAVVTEACLPDFNQAACDDYAAEVTALGCGKSFGARLECLAAAAQSSCDPESKVCDAETTELSSCIEQACETQRSDLCPIEPQEPRG